MDPILPSDMVGGESPELFPVGAVVRLRGGGPAMTVVDSKSHEGRRVCEWGNGGIGFYYIESLKDAGEGEGRYVFSGLCNGKKYIEIEVPIKECIGCGAIIPPSNDHGNWVYQEHQIDHNGPYCADCFSLKTETETEALVVERCDLCRFWRSGCVKSCRRYPAWQDKAADGWCGEFRARGKQPPFNKERNND